MKTPANKPLARQDDDDLNELPPMDGGEGEAEPEPEYTDLLDPDTDDGGGLDDSTAEDEPVTDEDLDAIAEEPSPLEDAEDAVGLDLGTQDLLDFDGVLGGPADFEEMPLADEDFGIADLEGATLLDSGEEGPEAEDEAIEELPALVADDDTEFDEAQFFPAAQSLPPWSPRPWEQVGAPLGLGPVRAVACVGRGVVAAGASLARVDLEGAVEPLEGAGLQGEVVRLVAGKGLLAAITTTGELFLSRDQGQSFEECDGWRSRITEVGRLVEVRLSAEGANLCVLTARGELLRSHDEGVTWHASSVQGPVIGLLGGGSEPIVALAARASRDSDLRVIDAPPSAHVLGGDARGDAFAYVTREGGVMRRVGDGGWSAVEGVAGAHALQVLDDAGTLLVAVYVAAEDATCLVRVDANGVASVVAELGGLGSRSEDEDAEARPYAVTRDDAHGVVWVAGGFGLVAFEPASAISTLTPVPHSNA